MDLQHLLEFAQTHVHCVGDAIQPSRLCHRLLLLPSIFPSIRVFSSESALHIRWPKYWSSSTRPSNEYSELISFRIDCFDFLAVQGTLRSLLQYHNSKTSILWHSDFFIVQLLNLYMTTGKTIALTRWTFVIKVMSLLFNMLSNMLLLFFQGVSFNFMAVVTICSNFGAKENNIVTVFHCFPVSVQFSCSVMSDSVTP